MKRLAIVAAFLLSGSPSRAAGADASPPGGARALLARAEALSSGASGAVDWPKAVELFRQALATGDPVASARWALLEDSGAVVPRDRAGAKRRAQAALPGLRVAAESGDAEGQYVLGCLLKAGLGTSQDDRSAIAWEERAERQGHVWACFELPWLREVGRGGPADLVAAEAGYRSCAERGNTEAMKALGRLGFNALKEKISRPEAVGWYRRAAERDDLEAQSWAGNLLLFGKGVPADRVEAMKWLEKATTRAPSVGYDLAFGLLTAPGGGDRARAAAVLESAAEVPNKFAMVQLGWMRVVDARSESEAQAGWEWIDLAASFGLDGLAYLFGVESRGPAERRLLEGELERLRKSSAAGSMAARALLARYYFDSQLRGEAEASTYLDLAHSAAEAGEKHAMRVLAGVLRNGWAGAGKGDEGLEWMRKSAVAGDSFGMMFYAQALLEGKEVPADRATGMRWLEQSAEMGNFWAMKWYARILDEGGYGVARDRSRALPYKRKLAELWDEEAVGWMRIHAPDQAP